jgi:hypothetical protein
MEIFVEFVELRSKGLNSLGDLRTFAQYARNNRNFKPTKESSRSAIHGTARTYL